MFKKIKRLKEIIQQIAWKENDKEKKIENENEIYTF